MRGWKTAPAGLTTSLAARPQRWRTRSSACDASTGSARCGWPPVPVSQLPPPTGSSSATACRRWPPPTRATGEPVRRYERAWPGELVHIDVKKLGRIPDGGGHKALGRAAGRKNRNSTGYAYLHTALDDHTRLAYTENLPDEKADTCADFLTRATAWFAQCGVTVERVLTDNAWAYSKNTWRQTCRDLGIQPRWTRPWRPQTNGKVERFHRTLLDEWAYQQPYTSEAERQEVFPDWLDWYNYHRPHTGISGHTPASRVTNLSGQHN